MEHLEFVSELVTLQFPNHIIIIKLNINDIMINYCKGKYKSYDKYKMVTGWK